MVQYPVNKKRRKKPKANMMWQSFLKTVLYTLILVTIRDVGGPLFPKLVHIYFSDLHNFDDFGRNSQCMEKNEKEKKHLSKGRKKRSFGMSIKNRSQILSDAKKAAKFPSLRQIFHCPKNLQAFLERFNPPPLEK